MDDAYCDGSVGITAVVVSRDLRGMLAHCLDHLRRTMRRVGDPDRHRLVVVDNASEQPYADGADRLEGAKIVRFDQPRSFAKANNAAITSAPNDLYLLANNDMFIHEEALPAMVRLVLGPRGAAICGTRMVFPNGTIQHCGVVFGAGDQGPYHWQRGVPSGLVPRDRIEWQAVTGACLLMRGETWEALGGLDEDYPFGLEDIDFCLRCRRRGGRVFCANNVDSLHLESQTPGRVALDVPSRRLFMSRWKGRYAIDG
jgi:GT2 family glycosyltransferase